MKDWFTSYLENDEANLNTETLITIDGRQNTEDTREDLKRLGNYIFGLTVCCVSNTGKDGIELYLQDTSNDSEEVYHLYKYRYNDGAICTVLDRLSPNE